MPSIYISHSPTDREFARRIANTLVALGADVWLDTPDLPNIRWHNDLTAGFEIADAMVVVLSPTAVAERRVIGDWNAFFERRKPVVLVTDHDDAQMGMQLEAGQYVDFYNQTDEVATRTLIETLRFYKVLPPTPPAASPPAVIPTAVNQGATIASPAVSAQPAAQPARTILNVPGLTPRRDAGMTQPSLAQETAMAMNAERAEASARSRWLLPAILGVILALFAIGALVFLVLLPQNERANAEATTAAMNTLNAQYLQLTADAIQVAAANTRAVEDAVLLATQQAAASAGAEATTTAQAATQMALVGTQQALDVVLAVTATADAFLQDAAELGALQATLSAQQAADRGVGPATPPTTHRFANQSLIFNLQREWFVNDYVVRLWQDPTAMYQALTIDRAGQQRIQIDSMMGGQVYDLTSTDITGEGNPDVIYEVAFAGSDPRCSVIIYDLGAQAATRIAETPPGMCGARFADLDGDGTRELIVNDPAFVNQFCGVEVSPLVEVVLEYRRDQRRFIPQSALFPDYYEAQAQGYLARADMPALLSAQAQANELGSAKCTVLGVVLPYLYGGMISEGWTTLRQYYTFADVAQFQARVNEIFTTSPFCK
jgi:succinate dehydrogenase hydrophobic anchor subunit